MILVLGLRLGLDLCPGVCGVYVHAAMLLSVFLL